MKKFLVANPEIDVVLGGGAVVLGALLLAAGKAGSESPRSLSTAFRWRA
jgi:ABC-type sugar transport system substrate-binding protein